MSITTIPVFIGGFGGPMEWAVILLIAVLLFGANKIPKLARATGQAMGEFQRGREEIEQEIEEMSDTDLSGSGEESSSDLSPPSATESESSSEETTEASSESSSDSSEEQNKQE
ncbi:MAG: twin-arginine translocase TatA/TatE family subunit [Halobacteriaceae archaeon]